MNRMRFAAGLSVAASGALADNRKPEMRTYLATEVLSWVNNSVLIGAIPHQIIKAPGYAVAEIDPRDKACRAQIGLSGRPTTEPCECSLAHQSQISIPTADQISRDLSDVVPADANAETLF